MYSRGSNALKNEYFTYDDISQQTKTAEKTKAEIQAKKRAGKIPVVGMGLESLWLARGPLRLKPGMPG